MNCSRARTGLAAHFALPAGFTAFLVVGAAAAALGGRLSATGVLILVALVVSVLSAVAEPLAGPALGLIGWLTVAGFSQAPYAQLRMTGQAALRGAATMTGCVLLGLVTGLVVRELARSSRLGNVDQQGGGQRPAGLRGRRQAAGALLATGLPLLTAVLVAARQHLDLTDDLLLYLVAVVAVAVVGGFWPAVLAAVLASLLLNWYFTEPLHTLTIAEPRNALALLLFVTVAVTVSSVVHLAARRQVQAARSAAEAASLLELAQTVLSGADTPAAVLGHLTGSAGGRAELAERVRGQWVSVAVSGSAPPGAPVTRVPASGTVALLVDIHPHHRAVRLGPGEPEGGRAGRGRRRLRDQALRHERAAGQAPGGGPPGRARPGRAGGGDAWLHRRPGGQAGDP